MVQRDLLTVIDEILLLVPVEEQSLREQLQVIRTSLDFAAPEIFSLFWGKVGKVLEKSFPANEQDFQDWHKKVINLWTTERIFPEVSN